jgi:outer membrane biosynthesis protein TonB
MLLLSLTTFVTAQDGATPPLPTGIDSKTPDEPKKEEPAPTPAAETKPADAPAPESKPAETPAPESKPAEAPAPEAPAPPPAEEEHEHKDGEEFLKNTTASVAKIDSISPAHGPSTGDTRVTVRGGPFAK